MTDLPVNIDAVYQNRSPGDAAHQQHHDRVHATVNDVDNAYDVAVAGGYTGTRQAWLEQIQANAAAVVGLPDLSAVTDPAAARTNLDVYSTGQVDAAIGDVNAAQGLFSARPAAGNQGATYFAADIDRWYRDDGAAWHPVAAGMFNVRDYGAVGDGVTNDTAAIQAALSDAQTSGGAVYLPAGTYLAYGLATSQSFNQPEIIGDGPRYTILDAGSNAASILKLVGGSGQLSAGKIEGIGFKGANATAIEIAGAGGISIERVRFGPLAVGLLFHNQASGSFTEMNVARNCVWLSSCALAVEYRKGAGNDSFHGSGFRDCFMDQPTAAAGPMIKVGAGCRVYNAPWDVGLFLRSNVSPILNQSTLQVAAFGDLRVETTAGVSNLPIGDLAGASPVNLAGHLLAIDDGVIHGGNFRLVERVRHNPDGSIAVHRKPWVGAVPVGTGSTDLLTVDPNKSVLMSCTIIGADYHRNSLLVAWRDPYDATGGVAQLATLKHFDGAGYGTPTFSFANGKIVITNASYPASGLIARLGISELGDHRTYPFI